MLSRTADHLFWLSRYIERAENTVRMLDMSHQTSMMPQSLQMAERSWRSSLELFNLSANFDKEYELLDHQDVLHFMCFDTKNPCSIFNCIKQARDNAKAIKGAITNEVWETINTTWLHYQDWADKLLTVQNYISLYDWVKGRSNLYRGVQINTMLDDEASYFLNLGTFLERADNIARLINIKFYTLNIWLDDQKNISTHADYYYWATVLRSVSAFEVFKQIYSNVISPEKVLELLIFNTNMPRSLAYSMIKVQENLGKITSHRTQYIDKLVGNLASRLKYGNLKDDVYTNISTYITNFLHNIAQINQEIADEFMLNSSKI